MANSNFRVKHGLEVTGSVGIGTTNPTAKLDVDGTLNVSGLSTLTGSINVPDSPYGNDAVGRIKLGDDGDLQIYHDPTTSYIVNSGPSHLFIRQLYDNGDIIIQSDNGSGGHTDYFRADGSSGSAILYHYGTSKFTTTGYGATVSGDLNVSGIVTTKNIDLTASNMSTGISTISGPATIHIDPTAIGDDTGSVRIKGDLYVDGTNFVVDSETITLADHIVGIASTATTDALTDGAGIQIGSDKTFTYDNTNTSLKSSENLNLASGKTYKINGSDVLSGTTLGTGVTDSSLTSVGTLDSLTVNGDVSLPNAGANGLGNILYDKSTGELKFNGSGTNKIKSTYTYGGDSFSVYQNLVDQSLIQSNTATDLYIAFNGSTYITDQAGSNKSAVFNGTGAAELYNNNSKKLETTSSGVTVTGTLTADKVALGDNERVELGNSADLALYHNNTAGYIDNDKGHLYIRNNVDGDDGSNIYIKPHDNEDGIIIHDDGGVELYYDNSKKLETTGGGVSVTGILTATSIDAAVSYAASAGIATTATNATNITIAATPSDTAVYPVFVATSSAGNQAPFVDSNISWNTVTNVLNLPTIQVSGGIDLNDNDYIYFGVSDDVKVFYDGTANDLEIELESAANGIAITDNGTYKHKITKTSVGINTGTPREELDVIGDIGVQASGASNRFSIQHNSAQNSLDFVFI